MEPTVAAVSPGNGMALVARGLWVKVSGKAILSGVSASFSPGTVSAIIGPSGSGKSTLLHCLATLRRPTQGLVLAGGQPLTGAAQNAFRSRLGFVPQDDIVHRELRVQDTFRFAARLRLDSELDDKTIATCIEDIGRRLGLAGQMGQRLRRLSGGQRKRVNIGIELLADPQVLILDEPASGLDPATEEDLIAILGRLAAEGRTVLLTSHSMEYLHVMHQVLVLMEGACIFCGPLPRLLAHFQIAHVADMYRTIRSRPLGDWQQRWSSAGGGA